VTMAAAEEARRPGRPRSAEADEAILSTTLEVFAGCGYDGLSVEAVAARAGVAKATIYRRYPSKLDLVMAACTSFTSQAMPAPDTGSLRGDVETIVANLTRFLSSTVGGRVAPQMIAGAARSRELGAAHRGFVAERRIVAIDAVRRAIDRGEVRRDADLEVAADLIAGPIFYRHLVTGAPLDDRFASELVESVVRALAP
jgi:AcrR family transcriptional regulator